MPQPLPPNNYILQSWWEAYDKCLHYEGIANATGDQNALIRARMLGYCIREVPDDNGRDDLVREINSCDDDSKFNWLATSYIHHFLRYFRAKKSRTPTPSLHPSRPSFDDTQINLKYLLEEAPQNHSAAKYKALIRDGYKCMLTGALDTASVDRMPRIRPLHTPIALTEAAHIFPEPTDLGITGNAEDGPKHDHAASVWAVMARFGDTLVFDELSGANVHRLENVMTLSHDTHVSFDHLQLWLESTGQPHTYTPNSVKLMYRERIPPTVTFTTPDPENLPLPSPVYLRLHAAAARVAHFSGAREYIEKILRDMEETGVLSTDGSSAYLLAAALGSINLNIR